MHFDRTQKTLLFQHEAARSRIFSIHIKKVWLQNSFSEFRREMQLQNRLILEMLRSVYVVFEMLPVKCSVLTIKDANARASLTSHT